MLEITLPLHLIQYSLSFIGIWIGSGLAIRSVERLSRSLKISSFLVSFIVLGLCTSISELSVRINSVIAKDPEIYVGNLVGATIVIFMLIIPLLTILGKSISITREFRGYNLPISLGVVILPALLALDGRIDKLDSFLAIGSYLLLLTKLQSKKGILEKIKKINHNSSLKIGKEILKVIIGVLMIFVSSRIIVIQTKYLSNILGVSPFLISLLLIGIGTNLPEISLVVRSAFMRNHQVAFGDYVGSAAFNTFLLGFLSVMYGKPVLLNNSYLISLIFLVVGLVLFYKFCRSKNSLSSKEGFILFILYLLFFGIEVIIHQ